MKVADVLPTLLDRLAATGGGPACFSTKELADWPANALNQLKTAGLLTPATPAASVICPGCEQECAMPVEMASTTKGALHAFVVCDKRDDTGRVPVPVAMLEQWQCTLQQLTNVLAQLLNVRRGTDDTNVLRADIGVLKGAKHSAHVVLALDSVLTLEIAGHRLPVVDVLELGPDGLSIERRALLRCVDKPIAAAGDEQSREQRVKRLHQRRNALKAEGKRNFNQLLAAEEGISVSAIKQLLREKTPPETWLDGNLTTKRTVQKKPKTQR